MAIHNASLLAKSSPLGGYRGETTTGRHTTYSRVPLGVTGHRILPSGAEKIVTAINARLTRARQNSTFWRGRSRRFIGGEPTARRTELRLISALAEGADRLAAREALRLCAELDVVLPFPRKDYEKDFPDAVADFRELLSMARVFTLDGFRDGAPRRRKATRRRAASSWAIATCCLRSGTARERAGAAARRKS